MHDVARRCLALLASAALVGCGGGSAPPPGPGVSVDAPPPGPAVSVDTPSLQFEAELGGADPAEKIVAVSNGGGGTLAPPTASVSYQEGAPGWLSATASGFTVTIRASTTGLARGHYAGTVTIEAAGASPVSVPVALDVTRPELAVSPATLAFATTAGMAPAAKTITVSNGGDGALAVPTATPSTLLAAVVLGTSAPFTVSVSLRDPIVIEGDWIGSVSISAANASNGPVTVPVTISVLPASGLPPGTVACDVAGTSPCQEYTSACGPARTLFEQDCAAKGGTGACPTDGRVGACVVSSGLSADADRYTYWYYAPEFTAALGQATCTLALNGTWVAP